jgi:hypothetical protein
MWSKMWVCQNIGSDYLKKLKAFAYNIAFLERTGLLKGLKPCKKQRVFRQQLPKMIPFLAHCDSSTTTI